MNPKEVVHFHLEQKPRHNNPTFKSTLVFGSLHAYGNTDYSKTLLKETEYKINYQKNNCQTITPSFNYSRRAGPHENHGYTKTVEKENNSEIMSRSYLSTYGANILNK